MTGPATPRPLEGLGVFVPRTPARGAALLAALRAAGADPVAAPLITIGAPADPEPMDAAIALLAGGGYGWVAVTSTFAVDGLQDAAYRRGLTLGRLVEDGRAARPGSTLVAAVGDATAAALARAGVSADFIPATEQSARGMLADWPSAAPAAPTDGAVLLPQSDLAEPDLAAGLAARGWRPQAVVAYTNSAAPALPAALVADLASGRLPAIVLTSGSAARRLAEQVAVPASTLVCCIGPRTAQVAAGLGLAVSAVASHPNPDAVVAALSAAVGRRGPDPGAGPEPTPTAPPTTPR
ncbi:uroporphyrinogen-III synthase [Pengzhenrongella sicca]|uniref:Uroporphyrinogen-III synthase n=1 Tax=Pengzhenrongella sicca TaxID=2819238 RepID=A0A8A4ZG53_9MICO|nr:uroporphyrinogen-III synthase [Pengzhenrongella sicca]QTE29457.1 uroporphyrinogen-III synthase [Pengzhenrongella sicca]